MTAAPEFYIGLMSGTSLDGVDGVLVQFLQQKPVLVSEFQSPIAPDLRATLLLLNRPGDNELHHAALAGNALARLYAQVALTLLQRSGITAPQITAIGVHGQTVRHQPGLHDGVGYTLQLNNPALLAELTGIDVVADFRSRDVAAGGQGAPLVPAFHQAIFAQAGKSLAVLNLGGMANLTLLRAEGEVLGFDCGPGNVLMDAWCEQHTGQRYDRAGKWALTGRVTPPLMQALLAEPYLALPPPKSTGRDLFNPDWLALKLQHFAGVAAADVQATLAEFTAKVCASALLHHAGATTQLLVCGGGARNAHVMQRLQLHLPGTLVTSTESVGIDPQQVEAMAFAWLARQCMLRRPGNLPKATGAQGPRVLGAVYPR
ncbi:MAG: anhydro-N-acetylmuramic acid kinase [Burkholderiaceae bacterium]